MNRPRPQPGGPSDITSDMTCGIEATTNFTQWDRIGTFGSGSDPSPREASTGQAPTNFLQNDPANTIDTTRLSVLILRRAN